MTWSEEVRDPALRATYREVHDLADWSPWVPFEAAIAGAPREPGVYLLRETFTGTIRHVGMAGERAGSGRPQGLSGRFSVYRTGKGAVSGFGEVALDLALADADWLEARLRDLRSSGPRPARDWVREAVVRLGLEATWAVCVDRSDAAYLEREVLAHLRGTGLWGS